MTTSQLIQKFEEIFNGNPWHGASTYDLLSSIPADRFTQIVAPGKKSIAHVLEHLLSWRQLGIEVMKGNQDFKIPINSDMDWPTPQPKGDPKAYYLSRFEESQTEILSLLKTKNEEWLDEQTPNKEYNNAYLMQGIVEHDLYHSGQVGIFNSLLNQS